MGSENDDKKLTLEQYEMMYSQAANAKDMPSKIQSDLTIGDSPELTPIPPKPKSELVELADLDAGELERDLADQWDQDVTDAENTVFPNESFKSEPTSSDSTWNKNDTNTAIGAGVNLLGTALQAKSLNELSKMQPVKRKPLQHIALNTDVNVQPQLNDIDKSAAKTKGFIEDNLSNAQARVAAQTSSELSAIDAKSKIRAQEETMEKQLKNDELAHIENTINRNINRSAQDTAISQDYNRGIISNRASLANETASNMTAILGDVNKQQYDKEELDILYSQYQVSGVMASVSFPDWLKQNKQ